MNCYIFLRVYWILDMIKSNTKYLKETPQTDFITLDQIRPLPII